MDRKFKGLMKVLQEMTPKHTLKMVEHAAEGPEPQLSTQTITNLS